MAKRGRPTKYRPEFVQKVDEYLATTGFKKKKLALKESFSLYIDVNQETLSEWAKLYPDFSAAMERIMEVQKQQLIDQGLYMNINPTIAKLVLSSNHGMKERTDQTTNDKDMPQPIYGARSTV